MTSLSLLAGRTLVARQKCLDKQGWPRSGCFSEAVWSGSSLFAILISNFRTFTAFHIKFGRAVVECLTWDGGAKGSSLTGVTALCPWARHTNPSLVLVQPRQTRPYITEILLMGHKESNQNHCKSLLFFHFVLLSFSLIIMTGSVCVVGVGGSFDCILTQLIAC